MKDAVAVEGTISRHRTLKDGTVVVEIELHTPDEAKTFFTTMTGAPAIPVVLARMSEAGARASLDAPKADPEREWPKYAHILWTHGFFRNPKVQAVAGSADDYLKWVRLQPSVVSGKRDAVEHEDGSVEMLCEAAHVRRADRAGTGIKPDYSAVALTHAEHRLQHDKGESALMPRDELERKASESAAEWCKGKIRAQLGYTSFSNVPLAEFCTWARERKLWKYVPAQVKELAELKEKYLGGNSQRA